jgi:hypothetical protein
LTDAITDDAAPAERGANFDKTYDRSFARNTPAIRAKPIAYAASP